MLLAESLLGTSSTAANYIEDVFSTYLYTGNGSTGQTITNGIDLSGKGGMVWIKSRSNATKNTLSSTASSNPYKYLSSNLTDAQSTSGYGITSFNSSGFFIEDVPTGDNGFNGSGYTYASWTFRKQAKFFDVVTFTAPSSGVITVNHNLGSVPGCVITKSTGISQFWVVNHRSLASTKYLVLDTNAGEASAGALTYTATATTVTFSAGYLTANANYVMYLFAHDAGGFGAAGSDNVISCGSYTGTGAAGNFVSLGYEPQWLLIKRSDASQDWFLFDNMRGLVTGTGGDLYLNPNLSSAEGASGTYVAANATGFTLEGATTGFNASGGTYIYIAIRRGPMKNPTSGTSVFAPVAGTGSYSGVTMTTNFPADAVLDNKRNGTGDHYLFDRLRSTYGTNYLATASSAAEGSGATQYMIMDSNTTVINKNWGNDPSNTFVSWIFRRAPGFFDVVCYTGTGSATTVSHNLGVAPELMIVKCRSDNGAWNVYSSSVGNTKALFLDSTDAPATNTYWNNTSPTSSVFSVGTLSGVNFSARKYISYLFATVAGVSKVGSYTGSGTTKQIDCGFTGGARFVLIKRTDSTGDWYVWDSARGIVAGDDPYLLLNSTAAEVTNTDYIDTYSAGFEISSTAPAAINASGGSYIFLAIA